MFFIYQLGEWERVPDIPLPMPSGTACSFQKQVLVFAHGYIYSYHPSYNNWTTHVVNSPHEAGFRDAVTWKDYIFLIGMAY